MKRVVQAIAEYIQHNSNINDITFMKPLKLRIDNTLESFILYEICKRFVDKNLWNVDKMYMHFDKRIEDVAGVTKDTHFKNIHLIDPSLFQKIVILNDEIVDNFYQLNLEIDGVNGHKWLIESLTDIHYYYASQCGNTIIQPFTFPQVMMHDYISRFYPWRDNVVLAHGKISKPSKYIYPLYPFTEFELIAIAEYLGFDMNKYQLRKNIYQPMNVTIHYGDKPCMKFLKLYLSDNHRYTHMKNNKYIFNNIMEFAWITDDPIDQSEFFFYLGRIYGCTQ